MSKFRGQDGTGSDDNDLVEIHEGSEIEVGEPAVAAVVNKYSRGCSDSDTDDDDDLEGDDDDDDLEGDDDDDLEGDDKTFAAWMKKQHKEYCKLMDRLIVNHDVIDLKSVRKKMKEIAAGRMIIGSEGMEQLERLARPVRNE